MTFLNKHSDFETQVANTSLDDLIRIKKEVILKKQAELEAELKKLEAYTSAEKVGSFRITGDLTKKTESGTVAEKVLKAFRDSAGKGLTNEEISIATGLELRVARDSVSKLTKLGKVRGEKQAGSLVKTFFLL